MKGRLGRAGSSQGARRTLPRGSQFLGEPLNRPQAEERTNADPFGAGDLAVEGNSFPVGADGQQGLEVSRIFRPLLTKRTAILQGAVSLPESRFLHGQRKFR